MPSVTGSIDVASDGTHALTQASDHTAMVWDAPAWRGRDAVPGTHEVASAALLASSHIVAATRGGVTIDRTSVPARGETVRVATSADDALLATASASGEIALWDARTGAARGSLQIGFAPGYLMFDPSSKWLVAGADIDHPLGIAIIDTTAMREVKRLIPGTVYMTVLVDATRLAVAIDREVHVFDTGTWTERQVLGASGRISDLALTHDGRIVTSSDDAAISTWDRDGHLVATLPATGRSTTLDISQDDRFLAVGTIEGSAEVWDLERYRKVASMRAHRQMTFVVRFSPDGTRLFSGGADGRVADWSLERAHRTQADLERLVTCRVPLRLEGETVLPRRIDFDDPACR